MPLPMNLALSGDGPVSQRLDQKKSGDRNFVFQVGSGLSAETGGNSGGGGAAGAAAPITLGNLCPWLIGAAALVALVILWPSGRSKS